MNLYYENVAWKKKVEKAKIGKIQNSERQKPTTKRKINNIMKKYELTE